MIRTTLLALAALGLAPSCITETEPMRPRASGMRTQGVVVASTPDALWGRVQTVLASMTREPIASRGLDRSAVTTVRGASVQVLVEPHARGAALHVTSSDARLADEIRIRATR